MHKSSTRNIIRRIEDLSNQLAKDYTNIHLIPRGTPQFIDQNLRGRVRFGKRQGNFLPVLAADNSSFVAVGVVSPSRKLSVTRVIPGFEVLGALLSIGPGRELIKISDINSTVGEITTETELIASHAEGTTIHLYGVPLEVIGNWNAEVTTIQVRSTENVFIGDQIAIDTTKGLVNSTVSTRVIDATFLGTAIDGRFNYEIVLEEGISRSLLNDEDIVLRAQPGYQSNSTRLKVNGPFVVDYISGPFFEDTDIEEFLNIQLLNALGSPLPGYSRPVSVGKNFAIPNVTIQASSMLFWDVVRGSVQFRDGKFIAITDSTGRFALSQFLVPAFSPGTEWVVPVRSNDTALLRIKFEPNDYRDFSLVTGALQRVTVGTLPTEQDARRIEVVVVTQQPFKEVEFNNWLPLASSVSSIVYQITSTAFGNNVWQAGSLMLKPYFFTTDDIAARYDFSAYDNGVIHF